MARLVLFTDNAQDLAAGFPGAAQVEMKSFPDGESYIRIPEACRGKEVVLLHRCYPSPNGNLIRLFLVLDAIHAQSPKSLRVFVPYLPYARMDKSVKPGEAISADTVCALLRQLGCTELITIDCHFIKSGAGIHERAGLRIRNFTAADALLAQLGKKAPGALVISPDQGASYMAKGGVSMSKVRGEYGEMGGATYRKVAELKADFNAKGKDIIIIDDMISTGSTMVKAVKVLKGAGAKKVFCAAAHGLFLNDALGKLVEAGVEEVICTSSIPSPVSRVGAAALVKEAI